MDRCWSEYRTTFCEPTKCILNYIISKGYVHDSFDSKHFVYNHFKNHFSDDMDKKLIGIKDLSSEQTQIRYISETMFNQFNNDLELISQSDIDNALNSTKNVFIIKRGVLLTKDNTYNKFTITVSNDSGVCFQHTFNKSKSHNGYMFCNIELVGVKNNDYEEFTPFLSQSFPSKTEILENQVKEHMNLFTPFLSQSFFKTEILENQIKEHMNLSGYISFRI